MTVKRRTAVWLVDDTESVRKSLVALLETADMTVWDFSSPKSFLDNFEPGAADFLIVDHHMPDMTGLELLQHLGAREELPLAVLVTAHGDEVLRKQALEAGAIAMLDKPVDGDDLIALIRTSLPDAG